MGSILRLTLSAVAVVVLATAAFFGDLALNQSRLFYMVLGRDGLVATCRDPMIEKLRESGFEPGDIEFGDTPGITLSSLTGKTLRDSFTFADGVSQTRVDGIVACSVRGASVTVAVRTATSPVRAT